MTITIDEFDMQFGPFGKNDVLRIEICDSYKDIRKGVTIAEFILSRPTVKSPNRLWIVEAKSSSPRPLPKPKFDQFIGDICEKFINSMNLFLAGVLGRNPRMQDEIPTGMSHISASNADLIFVLVIKGHQTDWLPPLRDALKAKLEPLIKTWKLSPSCVAVMNETIARQKGLIT
ncbi:hypothetical protein [Endozoicomonas sp. 4G]|uniref:hypothetical protein n=1 Tax=Endozoicomonas sp. 4G TaxID=2872754 RepID=UPI00207889A0|nr:hypothetical protein [Endozoicomonas sp. 4G]